MSVKEGNKEGMARAVRGGREGRVAGLSGRAELVLLRAPGARAGGSLALQARLYPKASLPGSPERVGART